MSVYRRASEGNDVPYFIGNATYYPAILSEAKAWGMNSCKKCFLNEEPSGSSISSFKSDSSEIIKATKLVVDEYIVINTSQKA